MRNSCENSAPPSGVLNIPSDFHPPNASSSFTILPSRYKQKKAYLSLDYPYNHHDTVRIHPPVAL